MKQPSAHLSDAEIEQYGNTVSPEEAGGVDRADQIEAHLADCDACRGRVLEFQRSLLQLADSTVSTARYADLPGPGPDCPGEDVLRDLAAGLAPSDQGSKLVQHAARCDRCGPLLRMYTEDFSDELTAEDQAVLSKIESSSFAWQKNLTRQMLAGAADSPADADWGAVAPKTAFEKPRDRKPFPWRWVLAPAALAACAAIAFAVWYSQRETPEKVEKLLAQAYTEQRTMEMRWPGAAWGPVRITRGPEDSRFSKPGTLLKAEGIIGEKQPANPANVEWIRARAQADILDRNPEAAVAALNPALETQPGSVPLMLDLSNAYFVQGEISNDPANYEKAADLLGQVLTKDPQNLTALFNRALLNEQLHLVDSAIRDWQEFLHNEKDPGWAADAQKRLSVLEELKRRKSSRAPPATIDEWSSALASNSGTAAEEAIDAAVTDWLPSAFPSGADVKGKPEFTRLLATAAQTLRSQYGDTWLQDLLTFSSSAHFPQAIFELSNAVKLNSQGKASDAIAPSKRAQAYFRRDGNVAGLARAQLEEVYAYQRASEGSACLEIAADLRKNISVREYPWMKTQLLLDEASCFNILGRFEEAKLDVDDALSQGVGPMAFKILRLRALGIAAALATTRGDRAFAVQYDLDGLKEYWAREYPIGRAYQFYSDLSFNAEAGELWQLAYAADEEAVWAISQAPNKQVEAIARYRLAKAAVIVGKDQVEETEIFRADRILAGMSQTDSTLIARTDGAISIVRAHLNLGETNVASGRLKKLNLPPAAIESRLVSRRLYQLKGDIDFKLGHFQKAQEAYLAAVAIAESGLGALHDDRDRFRWSQENGPSYRGLVNTLICLGDPAAALEVWELYRAAPIRRANALTKAAGQGDIHAHPTLADFNDSGIVPKALRDLRNETLIIYAFLPGGLGVWALDESGIDFKFAELSPREIRRLSRRFTEECSNPRSDLTTLRQDGNNLYKALIYGVSTHLKPGRLLDFETDGELDSLPLAALVDESGKYIIEEFAIVFSPGLNYRSYLRASESIKPTDMAVIVGDPAVGARWRRILPGLPSAKAEAAFVAAKFVKPIVLEDGDASKFKVRNALSKAKLFEFAGHSIQTNKGAALIFARDERDFNDGLTSLSEIAGHELRSLRLVVLSACSTGARRPNSRQSLATPFLLAGVPNIVLTRWDVESEGSLVFISNFYDRLLTGATVPESVQAAARFVITQSELSHPFYWAPFFDIGRN